MSIQDREEGNNATHFSRLVMNQAGEEPDIADPQRDGKSITAARTAPGELPPPEVNGLKVKLCGVCEKNEPKYKCARCYLPYCSIKCSTIHKTTHPSVDPTSATTLTELPTSTANRTTPRPGTASAVGFRGPFAALDNSEELQLLFTKYPRLSSQLNEIHTVTLPPMQAQDTQYPIGGRKSFNKGKDQAWSQDRGLQNGIGALRRAREVSGKDGEGVREFSKLILHIISGDDKDDTIRKELDEENARIIAALINGDI